MARLSVHQHKKRAPVSVRCGVVTVSDSRVAATDRGGPLIQRALERAGHEVVTARIVPDERDSIVAALRDYAGEHLAATILTGGTGLAPRDVTYEAVTAVLDKRIDGFGELFRLLSYEQIGPSAMLSRAIAGVIGEMVVFAIPGSPAACELALEKLILPELGHAVSLVRPAGDEP
jgi:molybdenum cofactor biosynthesis protein B